MNQAEKVLNLLDSCPDWDSIDPSVAASIERIVIGDLKGKKPLQWAKLPMPWKQLFPNLKHLHLWNLVGLQKIDELPDGLQTLELIRCNDLKQVAVPPELQTLDLEDCPQLKDINGTLLSSLEILSLRNCQAVSQSAIESVLKLLAENSCLQVFDGSHLPNLESIASLPKSCRRLHLSHCSSLGEKTDLDLEPFTELDFIDLSNCKSLRTIASFPDKVRYANLRGADALNLFLTQSIGEVDRQQEENAAKLLHFRKRFGHQRKIAPFAKLLLIGDGRVGKSTLACRLQKKPLPTAPTHGIEFWPWETNFQLTLADAQNLEERCRSIGLALNWQHHQLSGTVHLWDFGGQAYYHNTHRLFASAGTVFLICWKQDPTTEEQLEAEYKNLFTKLTSEMPKDQWIESNRPRTLDYWFDYVDAVSKNAKIALVCTHCPKGTRRTAWTDRCSPDNGLRDLQCFYIDSKSDDDWQTNREAKNLVKWIEQACGSEAVASGIDAPAVFADTIALITEIRATQETANKILFWQDWVKRVRSKHASLNLPDHDIETITKYLHGTGHLFFLDQDNGKRAVLIDQQWGAHRIYDILALKERGVHSQVRKNEGYLWIDQIRDSGEWQFLPEEAKDLLLEYMERCQLIHRIPNSKLVIVLEPWLLPLRKGVSGLDEQLSTLQSRIQDSSLTPWSYEREKVSETQFRSLMKALAEKLQKQCRWFREGMYASRSDEQTEVHLLVKLDKNPDDYHGRLQVELFTNDDSNSTQGKLCHLLREAGFDVPDSSFTQPLESRSDFDPHVFFGDKPETQYLVAISSSGGDKAIVQQIHDALKKKGLKPTWYRDGECRLDKYANAMIYMESLLDPPILLICLSDHYLPDRKNDSWYCAYEFARGVNKFKTVPKPEGKLLILFLPKDSINENSITPDSMHEIARKRFSEYSMYFFNRSNDFHDPTDRKIQLTFQDASEPNALLQLRNEFGNLGSPIILSESHDGKVDCEALIQKVKQHLELL